MSGDHQAIHQKISDHVVAWVGDHPLSVAEIDCSTAVMLKILDGKCKMKATSKVVMAHLYDTTKEMDGELLGDEIHQLIADTRDNLTEETKNHIYEKRVLAETMISRPVMKKFKKRIKDEGLLHESIAELVYQLLPEDSNEEKVQDEDD